MRTTQPVPHCPQCDAPVYRTHTCRASALRRTLTPAPLTPRPLTVVPPALDLVPMPEGWRELADQLRQAAEVAARRDAMHVVDLIDLANAEAEATASLPEQLRDQGIVATFDRTPLL